MSERRNGSHRPGWQSTFVASDSPKAQASSAALKQRALRRATKAAVLLHLRKLIQRSLCCRQPPMGISLHTAVPATRAGSTLRHLLCKAHESRRRCALRFLWLCYWYRLIGSLSTSRRPHSGEVACNITQTLNLELILHLVFWYYLY